jgi:hypothetical protein
LFLLAGLGFLPSALSRGDDAGKWVLAIGFFVVGLCFLLWANGRRRATHVQGGATAPSKQGA